MASTHLASGGEEELDSSRRSVLKAMAAAQFLLAFGLPAKSEAVAKGPAATARRFNAFVAINPDNTVTVISGQAEMGQGISTGLPQVVAAELGADWSLMRYEYSLERLPEYINPTLYSNLVLTAGSSSIPAFYLPARKAAAATREMLVSAAAKQWGVGREQCKAANSFISHAPSGRRLSFARLAAAASREPVPRNPPLRPRSALTLIGQPLHRIDVQAKITGQARFGIDAEVPGMLYAAVRHGRAVGSTVVSIDATKARSMPGVKLVMQVPQGVAVVADKYWQAVKALEEVKETYNDHRNALESTATVDERLKAALGRTGAVAPGTHGNPEEALRGAAKVIDAEYSLPLMAHACMEPVTCTASAKGKQCEIWLSTKSSSLDAGFAAETLRIDPASVVVHSQYLGGDFGRRSGREHVAEAVVLSKAVGRPVKVIWSRREDLRMDQHRTALRARVRMALDANGMPLAYVAKTSGMGLWQYQFPWWYSQLAPLDLPLFSLVGSTYKIPNEHGEFVVVDSPVRIGPWRGNHEYHNSFLLETMMDEAATAAGQDALAYRRKLLAADARSVAVLDRVAQLSNWGSPSKGRYQGISFLHSDQNWHARLAVVAEVSLQDNRVKVERLVGVCDSGLVINRNLAQQCIEGGLIFGLSNVMREQITLKSGAPEQENFDTYRLLRLDECPEVVVDVLSVGEEPGGYGEVSSSPVGPAVANAIFKATGKRIRTHPFSAQGIEFS
jgi:isoquinoline 1-oxidoreductase beta subunit